MLVSSAAALGATVPLAWDPSPSPEVTSYALYFGTNSRAYFWTRNVGSALTGKVPVARRGTNYYAATALDSWGLESDFSEELAWVPRRGWWSNYYYLHPDERPVSTNTNVVVYVSLALLTGTNLHDVNELEHAFTLSLTNPPEPERWWKAKLGITETNY